MACRPCLALLAALCSLPAPAQAPSASAHPGILDFYGIARDRAASPPDERKLVVRCAEKLHGADLPDGYEGMWISFLGAQPGRIQLVAFTKDAISAPPEVITLRPRYSPLPTARTGPHGTLDWAYVYDRNGDGRVDYLAYLQNAHAVLPDPVPADFPKVEVLADGRVRLSKELAYAMVEHAQMVFRHYADDRFVGSISAAVVEEVDAERPVFVGGYVAYLAPGPAGEPERAWAFRNAIEEHRRELKRDPQAGFLLPTSIPGKTEAAAKVIASATRMLGLINASLGRCGPGAGTLERAAGP